jgi:hypothetical protein
MDSNVRSVALCSDLQAMITDAPNIAIHLAVSYPIPENKPKI